MLLPQLPHLQLKACLLQRHQVESSMLLAAFHKLPTLLRGPLPCQVCFCQFPYIYNTCCIQGTLQWQRHGDR